MQIFAVHGSKGPIDREAEMRKMRGKAGLKRFMSLFMAVVLVVGFLPAFSMPEVKASGSGESWEDPILISTMDELFAALHSETSSEKMTYYQLNEDLSVDTYVEVTAGIAWGPNDIDRI